MNLFKEISIFEDEQKVFLADQYLAEILRAPWINGTYDENVDTSGNFEASTFFLEQGVKAGDRRGEFYRTNNSDRAQLIRQKIMTSFGLADCLITANDHILPPGVHIMPHIDNGVASGSSIIFPVVGDGVFTYDELGVNVPMKKVYLFNNKVRHRVSNLSTEHVCIFLVFHIGTSFDVVSRRVLA